MLVHYHSPIGKASYQTIHEGEEYSSYWMDCIERALENRMIFYQDNVNIGYYSLYDEIENADLSKEEMDANFGLLTEEQQTVASELHQMERKLFHDVITEGKDILKTEERYDEMAQFSSFSPYLFDDPEFASLVRDFTKKAAELNTLTHPCEMCISTKKLCTAETDKKKIQALKPLDVETTYQALD
jgi:hypothetical protein